MSRLAEILRRAERIRQTEGFIALVKEILLYAIRHVFQYRAYYLHDYLHGINLSKEMSKADLIPKIDDFTFKIVSTNQEADELEADGLDFRSYDGNARKKLDKGAIAFCVFIGQEFATMTWVAMTEEARQSMREPPVRVDFLNNEAYGGGAWTHPKYRRLALSHNVDLEMVQFLRRERKTVFIGAIRRGNIVALKKATKLGGTYAEARYLRILWWKSWKEKPLDESTKHLHGA